MSKVNPKTKKPIKEMEVVSDSDSDTESDTEPETGAAKVAPTAVAEFSDSESETEPESDSDSESEETTTPVKTKPTKPTKPGKQGKTFTDFEYKDNIMTVDINDPDNKYNVTLINSIRRIIIAELPNYSLSYDAIKFHENTSMLHNDMLAQRLCLLPLKYTTFVKYPNVNITYEHTNETEDMMEIYSGDFKATSMEDDGEEGDSIDITDIFTSPDFLFGKLKPDQRLHFTATVGKSIPRDSGAHMMMTSTATYWFKYDTAALDKIMASFKPGDSRATITEKVQSVYNSDSIKLFIDTIDEDDDHAVIRSGLEDLIYLRNSAGEPATYVFKIQDINTMKSPDIFKLAVKTLRAKIDNLIHATKMHDETKLEIFKSKTNVGSYQFDIGHEDFTLSYLIQYYFLQDTDYDYVGTIKPSPMKDMFILRTHLKTDNTQERNIEKFIHNLEKLNKLVGEFESGINF